MLIFSFFATEEFTNGAEIYQVTQSNAIDHDNDAASSCSCHSEYVSSEFDSNESSLSADIDSDEEENPIT